MGGSTAKSVAATPTVTDSASPRDESEARGQSETLS